ncbi:MAG: hypothetical protein ABGZ35_03020 [Planctomycetaceae bacterium]
MSQEWSADETQMNALTVCVTGALPADDAGHRPHAEAIGCAPREFSKPIQIQRELSMQHDYETLSDRRQHRAEVEWVRTVIPVASVARAT